MREPVTTAAAIDLELVCHSTRNLPNVLIANVPAILPCVDILGPRRTDTKHTTSGRCGGGTARVGGCATETGRQSFAGIHINPVDVRVV
ncbi:hypothetical protein CGCSCA5_v013849 [Colletotrichum siamense]|uniref:uncharacterized protein n=1 Tax=Colletotrichum siamense TaxID=690259 RepID=UPI00187281D4|nr:uncharacterized protein CGCS363_v006945 [Colletotrichum siamense]KAF4807006.1 hypothetical protein CGCSCA5_v013849 [Colletotrichum siamense]KAF5500553.1 hypothetical protein CGCS363_v006945 [Colletotrichum siamense]